jgi:eukaryotic-like serine/threonine-protein kinase
MTPERWQQLKQIFQSALERNPAERSAFLNQACAGDPALRCEVESLISSHDQAGDSIEAMAAEAATEMLADDRAIVGKQIGHYQVLSRIGRGGMGEVFLAQDARLGRKIALKLLRTDITRNEDRLRRFRQEARAASALNHPNILTIHEIGQEGPLHFMATEYVEGETLRHHISRGSMTLGQALDVAVQVAGALAAAHHAGIIHRDIKPENVMLRTDGYVKVLDFGLAKLAERKTTDSAGPTLPQVETEPGLVMGTVSYMSPEQARGLGVDTRTDIWSLGVMIYEMASGRQPFEGKTASDVMSLILQKEPRPLTHSLPEVPGELERIVRKALRKDKEERYQTIKDLLIDLRNLRKEREFESEMERSAPPMSGRATSSGQTAAATVHYASSAEYIVEGLKQHKRLAVGALALILTVSAVAAFFYFNRRPALTDKDTILLADVVNTTGDPVFDGTLKQALAVQLGQSPFLNLFPEDRVRETLGYMGRSPEERLTKGIAREIGQREGLKAVLIGSIASLGSHYVITLETLNSQTGDALAHEQVEAESKEQVISKLGEAVTKLREKLGESLASIRRFDTPLAQATTSSLEALKAYTLGRDLGRKGKDTEAVPFLKRAVELDPNFASAYASLAVIHSNIGDGQLSVGYAERAFELRGRTSESEKFFISNIYYSFATGEIDKSTEVLELWKQTYPRDFRPVNNLSTIYASMGQYDNAAEEAGEAIRLDPKVAVPYGNLARYFLCLNRFDEARAIFEQAVEKKLDPYLHADFYALAFVQGDEATMQREVDWAKGKPFEGVLFFHRAHAAAFSGQRRKSQELFRRSAEINDQYGLKEFAAWGQSDYALLNAAFGDCQQMKGGIVNALNFARNPEALIRSALALAQCGETSRAQSLADEPVKRYPKDTILNNVWRPMIQAALEINRGNTEQAIQLLQVARRFEMGQGAWAWPAYVRGLAYLRGGAGADAMAEFQKIIDHRGLVATSALYPLAHLGVARAAALTGDTAKSRKAYQDFFALWKDADPDIPILQQAKQEYEKLK